MAAADYMTGLAGRYAGREMAATDPAPADAVRDAAAAARAARLEEEVKLLSRRLRDAESARAGSEREIATMSAEVAETRAERRLWVRRVLGPLIALERGIRWLAEKAGRAGGMVARQVIFRGKRMKRGS
jgi:hypothetical protein